MRLPGHAAPSWRTAPSTQGPGVDKTAQSPAAAQQDDHRARQPQQHRQHAAGCRPLAAHGPGQQQHKNREGIIQHRRFHGARQGERSGVKKVIQKGRHRNRAQAKQFFCPQFAQAAPAAFGKIGHGQRRQGDAEAVALEGPHRHTAQHQFADSGIAAPQHQLNTHQQIGGVQHALPALPVSHLPAASELRR